MAWLGEKLSGVSRYFNRQLTISVMIIAISSFNYGFDNQGFATTQATDAFQRRFGDKQADGTYQLNDVWLSLFSSLIEVGFAVGIIIGSLITRRFGRRKAMFVMSIYELGTATVIITSQGRNQILVGRILNYVYVGMEIATVPIFQSEIVPGPIRGFVVSTYQFALILGGLIMNIINLGTSRFDDDRAWKIPFGLFYIIPVFVASTIFLIPESPRWLLVQGRRDEARANLTKLREGRFSQEEIDAEFAALDYGLENESEKGSFKELFQGLNTKRTMIAIGAHFFQNLCGQAIVSKFGSLIVKSLHSISPFVGTVIFALTNLVFVFIGMTLADKIGRRPLLLMSTLGQMGALLVLGGIGTTGWPIKDVYKPVALVFLVVQTAGFSIGFAPLGHVVGAEVIALRLREPSQMISCCANVLANFAVGFSLPYLLNAPYANLHLQVGWVFAPICFIATIFVYFMVPECKGKTLEQIDHLFQSRTPIRKFGSYKFPNEYVNNPDKLGPNEVENVEASANRV
ncbi:sugar transporter [Astrocystis sublimbata]|nr:sugar transporter [Astrocystis sublimbata]